VGSNAQGGIAAHLFQAVAANFWRERTKWASTPPTRETGKVEQGRLDEIN